LAAKWAREAVEDPLDTFVGRYENQFNTYMSKAERALKEGKYYDAAQLYGLATSIDPRNPLPLLGRGHAYIATGDYLSAFESIRQGIERFPQIAAFRLDLPAMVGQSDAFDLRRSDLEKRLADGEFYKLRFLLGYLEIYSGLVEDGILNLERAAKYAPPGDIVAAFPDLLLGKRELPSLKSQAKPLFP
jgi:tetratricopeptide (TPR) repeat protein